MIIATRFFHFLPWRNSLLRSGLTALILLVALANSSLTAAVTVATPAQPQPAAGEEDFGQYLADHQDDLGPFFDNNRDELVKQSVPMFLGFLASIMFFTMALGWVIDIGVARVFTPFFAPAYAKMKPAIIYATGRLVLSVVAAMVIGLTVVWCLGVTYAGILILVLGGIFGLIALACQVAWIAYVYRMNLTTSVIFYVIVLGIHSIVAIIVAAPVLGSQAPPALSKFVDQTVTPKLQIEITSVKQQLAVATAARDKAKAAATDPQNQIDQANAEQQRLTKEIEDTKNSEAYIYQGIARIHAQGHLADAHDQLTAFIARFPSGSFTPAAKAQLAQLNGEIAVQDAQKKQADADAAVAAAQARADLLARAGKGEVTLSEMRQVLIGKTRPDVKGLFGDPTETASDRWGYGQQMIVNPLTGEKHGLTIYFLEGAVQGVDYYYGNGVAK